MNRRPSLSDRPGGRERDLPEGMTRRRFMRVVAGLGALGLLEPHLLARILAGGEKRLSYLAYRAARAEGSWTLKDIEGKVPGDLHGTLYRVAPGQTENHGIKLRHFFDGDAYLSGFSFRNGKVTLRSQFIATPEREEEIEGGRMLFNEFGTLAPRPPDAPAIWRAPWKNQPNVNVIHWDDRLLGLSEGGHPTEIDPADLSYRGRWDFHGTLPGSVGFTAHPKYDPATGEAFGFGVTRSPPLSLMVYRMEGDGTLTRLHAVKLTGYLMIHDMLITREHLIFVIPPVQYSLLGLLSGQCLADALRYLEKTPLRIMLLRRDGTGKPITIEQPANMVFHNGNAFKENGRIVIDTILFRDDSILELLHGWARDELPESPPPRLTRLVLDSADGKVVSRSEIGEGQEFPRFDIRKIGQNARYLYTVEPGNPDDPLAWTALVQNDLHRGTARRVEAGAGRVFGEPIFQPHPDSDAEDRGWLLVQGYDGGRDESFLEIRDAGTLDLEARVWTGFHFPLGFHGNFTTKSFVSL